MKRIVWLWLLFVSCLSAWSQEGMSPLKTFVPDNKVHDFGVIKERDGKVSHTFFLRNKGQSPVVICDVSAWCGCTTVDYTKKPVRPGDIAKVTVTYDPKSRPGKFSKEVAVITSGGRTYTRLWVKGSVVPYLHPVTEDHPYAYGEGLYMNYKVLSFPDLAPGQTHKFELKLANDTDRQMKITFRRNPDNRVLKMPAEITLQPRQRTSVTVTYRYQRRHAKACHVDIIPIVNGKKLKPLVARWHAAK